MDSRIAFRPFSKSIAAEMGESLMLPVIEKELLHYEILQALPTRGLLDGLVDD